METGNVDPNACATGPTTLIQTSMRSISPPSVKRERSDDEEPARRVEQCTEPATQMSEKEAMVKIVLEDLRSNDERTLEQAMQRLGNSLYDEDDARMAEKQKPFFQIGGHLAVCRAMKEHLNFKMLQSHGICVLQNATCTNSSARTDVAKVEGIQAIVTAMQKFPREKCIILNGFEALSNIVCGHEANADLLVKTIHAIPFLVERMAEFKHDEEIMINACGMLDDVCCFPQLRESIVDAKGISALAFAIESHRENHDIQEAARAAMKKLM